MCKNFSLKNDLRTGGTLYRPKKVSDAEKAALLDEIANIIVSHNYEKINEADEVDGVNEVNKGETFVLRLYDMFDGWIDIEDGLTKEDADAMWNKKTLGGTCQSAYVDGDYYKVFPSDTRMVHTPEFRGR